MDERSSLPLSLPFPLPCPLPCPFLPLPLPLSAGLPLPLPLPLAMSGSIGLKSRISIERNGSEVGSTAIPGGRRGVVPGAPTGVTPECWKKGIRVPSRGATTRRGVRYQYLNIRERGECSGDRVGGGGVGRIRRRDRDTWRVRERRGRFGMW